MTTDERIDALEKALETSVRRQRITIAAPGPRGRGSHGNGRSTAEQGRDI